MPVLDMGTDRSHPTSGAAVSPVSAPWRSVSLPKYHGQHRLLFGKLLNGRVPDELFGSFESRRASDLQPEYAPRAGFIPLKTCPCRGRIRKSMYAYFLRLPAHTLSRSSPHPAVQVGGLGAQTWSRREREPWSKKNGAQVCPRSSHRSCSASTSPRAVLQPHTAWQHSPHSALGG